MKQYLLLYTSIVAAWFVLSETQSSIGSTRENSFDNKSIYEQSPPPCSPSCQLIDSVALVAIYNSLNGPSWVMNWNLNDPVCSWFGVTLDANGFADELILGSNGLSGNIPIDIGLLSKLRILQLDNNAISGSVPSQIGMLSELEILFLDDNLLSGSLPDQMGNLNKLQTIFIDNNFIDGTVPATMASLNNLQRFELFNNRIDSLPDFSGIPNMQDNKFKFQNNRLTFDDILPNLTDAVGNFYQPQDSICEKIDTTVATGSILPLILTLTMGSQTMCIPGTRTVWLMAAPAIPTSSRSLL